MNLFTKQRLTDRKQTYGCQRGKGDGGRDKLAGWGEHIHTTIYKIDNLYSTGNYT